MNLSPQQLTAFQNYGGFSPAACAVVLLSLVFAVLLLWGVWAVRTAYTGWAESKLNQRQLAGVAIRFFALYLVLSYFLLS